MAHIFIPNGVKRELFSIKSDNTNDFSILINTIMEENILEEILYKTSTSTLELINNRDKKSIFLNFFDIFNIIESLEKRINGITINAKAIKEAGSIPNNMNKLSFDIDKSINNQNIDFNFIYNNGKIYTSCCASSDNDNFTLFEKLSWVEFKCLVEVLRHIKSSWFILSYIPYNEIKKPEMNLNNEIINTATSNIDGFDNDFTSDFNPLPVSNDISNNENYSNINNNISNNGIANSSITDGLEGYQDDELNF